jgi:2-dehydropantoate 2-reductase
MREQRIAIVGAGANGAAVGADMVNAGLDVTFIEQWPAHVEVMRRDGLRVDSPDGTEITQVRAFHVCEVATLRDPFDLVVFGVKAYDTRWSAELIKPLLSPDGVAVGIQNGMSVADTADVLGPERTLGAVIEIAGNMFTPGVVDRQVGRAGTWFALGAPDPAAADRVAPMAEALAHAGRVDVTDDILSSKWMKLVANAAEMVPSAILGVPLVEALHVEGMREVMDAAGTEALDAGLALGHKIVPMFGQEGIDDLPPEAYSGALLDAVLSGWSLEDTRVAVLQDWMKGRHAEGEEINGLVVEEQRRRGVTAPVNERLMEVARRIESGELEPSVANAELLLPALER